MTGEVPEGAVGTRVQEALAEPVAAAGQTVLVRVMVLVTAAEALPEEEGLAPTGEAPEGPAAGEEVGAAPEPGAAGVEEAPAPEPGAPELGPEGSLPEEVAVAVAVAVVVEVVTAAVVEAAVLEATPEEVLEPEPPSWQSTSPRTARQRFTGMLIRPPPELLCWSQ